MEKRKDYRTEGLWVVRDHDGLYLCNRKPWKNYHDIADFVWACEGDFIKIDKLTDYNKTLDNLKFDDDPVMIVLIPQDEYYSYTGDVKASCDNEIDEEIEFPEPNPMTQEEHDKCDDQKLLYEHWAFKIMDATYEIRTTHKDDPIESITVNKNLGNLLQENSHKGIKCDKKIPTDTYYFIGCLAGYNIYVDETMDNTDYKFIIIQK